MSEDQDENVSLKVKQASWSIDYVTSDGYVCKVRLVDDDESALLGRAGSVLNWLRSNGCRAQEHITETKSRKQAEGKKAGEKMCPIHNVKMKKWEKNGKVWYSHLIDGEWCSGK